MGRQRKPLELRLLDGTYQPSRHGPLPDDGEPREPPEKPARVKGEAAKVWSELSKSLAGVLRESDGHLLADLCFAWAQLRRCQTELSKHNPGDTKYQRTLICFGICSDKVNKLAGLFGLTPSDRAKLRFEQSAGPAKAKVATRPRTALDREGPPGGAGG
jgi:P27 family predicted phage terminase small subunit